MQAKKQVLCQNKVPENILLTDDHAALCHWLCTALVELCKEDCGEYTPRSLSQFLLGCSDTSAMKSAASAMKSAVLLRLADPTNPNFRPLHQALDNRYRELHPMELEIARNKPR